MTKFPFGNVLFRDTVNDCSICLGGYTEKDQVVQLKCSKFHIFHYDCIKGYIDHIDENEKKCPLCRQNFEI